MDAGLRGTLLRELLRDSHGYAPGADQERPGELDAASLPWRRRLELVRGRARNLVHRSADRAGFHRRHYDPERATRRLEGMLDAVEGLERAYASVADEHSRRIFVDVLKLRVLGPSHIALPVGSDEYRARQAGIERRFRVGSDSIEVADPFFSRLHLYELPRPGGGHVRLYSHSMAVLNIFGLEQYAYRRAGAVVAAEGGDVAIDAGGCWGDSALYLAGLVGPEGRVFSFEFAPDSLAVMRRNLELNPELASRIEIVEEALWDRSSEELSFSPAGQFTSLAHGRGDGPFSVRTTTLDDWLSRERIDRADFLKVDVEGAEPNVVRGAAGCLREHAPKLAIAAYHRDTDLAEIPALVAKAQPAYRFFLDHFSAGEDETVLFAAPPS